MAHDHDPAHPHAHSHGHGHHHAGADSRKRLAWAVALTGGFMIAEVAGGILSGSLALLADAGHMLTDTAALALAWFAARLSQRPADHRRTYGYDRVQILAAFVNGLTLIAIVVWIAIEALRRFLSPVEVAGTPMLAIAALGFVINLAVFALLHLGDRDNLNIRGAALHVLGDLLGSVAAIVAALVILTTGWTPIDPLLSLLVAALILRSAWRLTRESGHILLEGAPASLDVARIERELPERLDGVYDVHHVHAWSMTPGRHLLSLHAAVEEGADREATLVAIKAVLLERFDVAHATIQLESPDRCADDVEAPAPGAHRP
ncbi:Cadmium, cobalt and zinc/H(+)-K(+) antiporter [Halomonas sp. THAF12]|uniref:cation diffusion facilitator family transporter n=1 Tax=Halomonas sp. THAF12 TaxID=2587849 RepID=UPI0012687BED|nr:cation diffusion facilitator family transporter [Halomonas sp. THAF12]QFT84333.1 Cadmium, cobalt and zinc/H(+)-K(+) antiporter [Halomonas sp. THAF12]